MNNDLSDRLDLSISFLVFLGVKFSGRIFEHCALYIVVVVVFIFYFFFLKDFYESIV